MKNSTISSLKERLNANQNIIIVCHKNPDGDAIGSSLGLCHFLTSLGNTVTVITPNDYPAFLKWVPGEDQVIKYDQQSSKATKLLESADLIFTLDFNHFSRTGMMENVLGNCKATFVMIDHHQQPDNYAEYTFSDTSMSSTCQMVFHFIEQLEGLALITPEIATCLYLGIMTDTGSFRYRSTTATTHKVLAALIEKGADNTAIHQHIYDANSFSRFQLLGIALNNLKVVPEYNLAYITLSQKELDDHHFKKGDTEGFVNYGLSLSGVKFAAIFIENKQEQIIKISFRSKGDFSVNEFARAHFEGGGHTNAAGGKSTLSLAKTIDKFISILPPYKTKLS